MLIENYGGSLMLNKSERTEEREDPNEKINVFVYGTLMKGNCNYESFLSNSKFIGEFIAEGFALYDLGDYPGIIYSETDKVKGHLYRVDKSTLGRLDDLEEEGSLYIREVTEVVNDSKESMEAYIYVYKQQVSGKVKVDYGKQPWGLITLSK